MKHKQKFSNNKGFTLIELLVVIAIIALLSSVALIAFMSARQKGRDAKRLGDLTQMNTALELYFATYKGYPSSPVAGVPGGLVPGFASSLANPPMPPDGGCDAVSYPSPVPAGHSGSEYYYYPSGTQFTLSGVTVYPDYGYYFCLGNQTGNFGPGLHIVTPKGLK